jgi:hypothetical protein
MNIDSLRKVKAEDLNKRRHELEMKIELCRSHYRLTADREVAKELQEVKFIDYEFHRRGRWGI